MISFLYLTSNLNLSKHQEKIDTLNNNMLQKIIHAATKPKSLFHARPKFIPPPLEESSSALRIVHAGGIVEQYYMAVPAARIIEKYPSFTLTRPDVFRRPWDAVVRPEEILIPGQKYYVVPRRTVKKLKRRIKKPSGIKSALFFNSVDASSAEMDSSQQEGEFSSTSNNAKKSGIMIKSKNKTKVRNCRVRFFGIDIKQDAGSVSSEHSINSAESVKKSPNRQPDARKRRARNVVQWEPSLTSIQENHGADELFFS